MWVPGSVIIGVVRIVLPAMGCSVVDDVPVTVVAKVAAVNPVAVATVVPAIVVVRAQELLQ
jgi:hypothetical protein